MRKGSQIATILTLTIAAIFLFIVITINIGKVSERKTIIDNACDGTALLLASNLASVATSLKQELELFGDSSRDCNPNWTLIGGILLCIGALVGAYFTGGASLSLLKLSLALISISFATVAGSYMVGSEIDAMFAEPGLMQEIQAKYQNMTAEQRLFEVAMQHALFATINDPAFVPDRFDTDRDGQKFPGTLDKIPQFNHWYFQRLNSLPRIGELIEKFYHYLFKSPPQFKVKEDPESWKAEEVDLLVNGSWKIGDWLEGDFKSFIHEYLWKYGYGVYFEKENISYKRDDLDILIKDIRDFEEVVGKEIYNASKDELIAGFEGWITQFYDGKTSEDWWDRMGEWLEHLDGWINGTTEEDGLWDRHDQVLECVGDCQAPGPYECRPDGDGHCCECHWYDPPCEVDDEGNEYCPPPECICDNSWCGCGTGILSCCQLCPSHCTPTVRCATPTGGSRLCCNSGCMIYEYSCSQTKITTGSNVTGCCSECEDTYYPCGCSERTKIEDYIALLEEFRVSIVNFRNEIQRVALKAAKEKDDPWRYKAIYVWKDKVLDELGKEVEQETPVHMVYVKIDVDDDFIFPYPHQGREWGGLVICKTVEGATDEFDITIARYDEDLAKKGPLSKFWGFKFRRHPGEDEVTTQVERLQTVADNFYDLLKDGQACELDALISPGEADRLGNFAFNNGIAAKVRVHYGPGMTYEPGVPGEAKERNKEIYIKERYR